MKTNKMMRLASVLLVAVMLTTCAISGTFAKYVSTASGSDNARVAKWDVAIGGEESFTFDLFETINDTDGQTKETDVNTGLIAPGTSGSFTIELSNASEVTANYVIDYTVTNDESIPILFSVDSGKNWTSNLTDVDETLAQGDTSITVQWKWAYEQTDVTAGDATDTTLGIAGNATVTVDAKVTVTQVD